jgi:hypothetical protein
VGDGMIVNLGPLIFLAPEEEKKEKKIGWRRSIIMGMHAGLPDERALHCPIAPMNSIQFLDCFFLSSLISA